MTVLLHDAVGFLEGGAKDVYAKGDLCECVYADDTLLIGTSDASLNGYLKAISDAGRRYGMELHWDKFQ
eukprot:3948901-Pyramimonas_sp.AAC.1